MCEGGGGGWGGVHSASTTTNVPYLVNYLVPPFSHFTIDVGEKREKETGQKKMLLLISFLFLCILVPKPS